jgi:hypothetical protein
MSSARGLGVFENDERLLLADPPWGHSQYVAGIERCKRHHTVDAGGARDPREAVALDDFPFLRAIVMR